MVQVIDLMQMANLWICLFQQAKIKKVWEVVLFNSIFVSFPDGKDFYYQAIHSHKPFEFPPQNTELCLKPTLHYFNVIPFVIWSKSVQIQT